MKKTFLSLCLLASTVGYTMEPKDQIGELDTLVLKVAIEESSFDAIKETIQNHEFTKNQEDNPYTIIHLMYKSDTEQVNTRTELCIQAMLAHMSIDFGTIELKPNERNLKNQEDLVDYCTSIKADPSDKSIKTESRFYDKELLLQVLHSLNPKNGQ